MPRIDYVSPLPPVRSGIADYSVDLLTALEQSAGSLDEGGCRVRVVRVAQQDVADDLVTRWNPVDFLRLGEDGRVPVYHMGNNPYHLEIYEAALKQPGVVVLHDVFLHHLLQERTLAKTDVEGYIAALERDHGWIGRAVAMPPRWSGYGRSALFSLAAHRTLLERQRGIIVHSEWARRFLIEEGIERPIARVPMVMPVPPLDQALADRASFLRQQWGVGADAFLLGSFGFQTPIKRTSTAIRALAQPGLERVQLVIAGDATKGVDLEAEARRFGVQDRVHLVGFLPSVDFSAAIRACDLTVNLRYPTAGETSASLLRVLALGRGAIVSDYAQFRDLSTDFSVRVGLGSDPLDDSLDSEEVLLLSAQLKELVRDRPRVVAMGRAAREHVAVKHAPAKAAHAFTAALTELVSQSASFSTPSGPTAMHVARRPTSLTWGRLESHLNVEGLEGWRPGELRTLSVTLENCSRAKFLAAKRGNGGIMFELLLVAEGEQEPPADVLAHQPWLGLPRDLEPGESCTLQPRLRRPLGSSKLMVEPHVVGGQGFSKCGGATFTRRLD